MKPLLYYLLQVIVASGILYAYYHFFLRNKKFHHYNRFYILMATLISVFIPFLNIPIYFTHSGTNSSLVLYTLSNISAPVYEADPAIITTSSQNWFTWQHVLYAIYILIAAIVLLRMVLSLRKIRLIIKKNPVERIERIRFVNTEEPGTPFSFFRWLFWNRKIELNSEKGEQIFRHELFHIEQKHSLDILFMELITIVFWVNPFFQLMKKELKAIHEFLADQFAVSENNKWEYAELLLMQALNTQNNLTNPFFHNQIKRRIAMLTTSTKPGHLYLRKVLVLPVAAMVLALVAFKYKEKNDKQVNRSDILNNSGQIADTTKPSGKALVKIKSSVKLNPPARINPTTTQLKNWEDSKMYGVWLDGKRISNSILSKYSPSDISHYDISNLSGNAITYGKHYYQVDLMTNKYYNRIVSEWNPQREFWMTGSVTADTIPTIVKGLNDALIVIDGEIHDNVSINSIDPENISSITIYKNSQAVDKYGAKGKNGVIEITTKQNNDLLIIDTLPKSKNSNDNKIFEKVEVEASFPGGEPAWRKYLERNLAGFNPAINGAPNGTYTVYVQFIVDKDGNISDIKPLTHYGYGMEDAAIRVVKKGPNWEPAIQNGHKVKAYRKQPVSFIIKDGKKSDANLPIKEVRLTEQSKSQILDFRNKLIVIDGIKYPGLSQEELNKKIQPQDIFSISIIKDAPAIAKYGDNGKNGVIEIVTKKNKRLKIKEITLVDTIPSKNIVFEKAEVSPSFPGGSLAWKRYLERTLSDFNPADSGAKEGTYTVMAQFIVDQDGNLSDIKTLTHFGYGMEGKVIEMLKKGPNWEPAIQNDHKVKAYVKQPVTFVIQNEDDQLPQSILPKNIDQLSAIYPNPTTNNVTVPFSSESDNKGEIRIYDEMGSLKITAPVSFMKGANNFNINISSLAKGIYVINVIGANKAITKSYKMIKE